MEKLTLAQMPDSSIYQGLSNITLAIEQTVGSVHGVLDRALIAKRDEYAAEALRRLQE